MKRLLNFAYELLYGPLAWSYDWIASLVSAGMWQEWTRACLPYLTGPRILELGYGPGHLQVELAKNGLWSVGIDSSQPMSRIARGNLQRSRSDIRLINGYAQSMCFSNDSFDQVVAAFPSNYILDAHTLKEVKRVLKPGGCLIVAASAWAEGPLPAQCLTRWLAHPARLADPQWIEPWLEPFNTAGFSTQAQLIDQGRSKVWVILARQGL